MQHTKVPANFRQSLTQGQHRSTQLASYARQTYITGVLSYVLSELVSAQTPIVKSAQLCLTNIYSVDSGRSLGFAGMPDYSLEAPDCALVLTFSMTPRVLKNLPFPETRVNQGKATRLWGTTDHKDYITICVPRSVVGQSRMITPDYLAVVYNAVGIVSRNYCSLVKTPLNRASIQPEDISVTASYLKGSTASNMMNNIPFTEWTYCSAFWANYSHCLIPSVLDKDFTAYYTLFLDGWLYEGDIDSEALAYVKDQQQKQVTSGLSKISIGMVTGYIDNQSADVQATLHLILRSTKVDVSDLEGSGSARARFVAEFNQKVQEVFRDVPMMQSKVIGLINSNQTNLARGILDVAVTYRQQAKDLSEYLELIMRA